MEPNFQSSFIPKGPAGASVGGPVQTRSGHRDIISFVASIIFTISVVMAGGVFLYKLYINYRITAMGQELESARAALSPETVRELIHLNNRLVSTDELLRKHRVLSPLFDYLANTTPKSVRYTEFNFTTTDKGITLVLKGEARGYTALAQAADLFNQSGSFKDPTFSDLSLDERGNVVFSLRTSLDPQLLSYEKMVEKISAPITPPVVAPVSTSTPLRTATATATSTAATSTKKTN